MKFDTTVSFFCYLQFQVHSWNGFFVSFWESAFEIESSIFLAIKENPKLVTLSTSSQFCVHLFFKDLFDFKRGNIFFIKK